jgi:hypothetical protein
MAPPLAPDVVALLSEHAEWLSLNEAGQVVCRLTGHSMPPRAPVVLQFLRFASRRGSQQPVVC